MLSKLVHSASWLAAVLTVAATAYWIMLIADGNCCWGVLAFTLGIALPLGSGILFLGVLPSCVLCIKTKQRRDLICFVITGGAFVILLVETIVVNFILPQ